MLSLFSNWLIPKPRPAKDILVMPSRAQSVNPNLNFEFPELLGLLVFCGEFVEVLFVWEVLPILECTLLVLGSQDLDWNLLTML